ncbi:cysteine desulfurase family protein [Aquimarina hainanensis]|uniref:Cysteine desulfurase family protein n=1 Tax=Aquimarina hainanensis TaxID=1578017 RepID=A0ABW5NCX1_9FLAO|nr:cysteine desulfurase family protein [Aquimarina sp. TRL1]QKX07203.1 cysteine desulfurase [Aquimarina sp. TRL1]
MRKVYLDNAATTELRQEVIDKMVAVLKEDYGNPSSTHGYGRSAKNYIEQARKNIAKSLGVKASEIIFTSGGTEADNLALNSAVRDLGVKHIITSKIEHHAVLHTVQELAMYCGVTVSYVKINRDGSVDYDHLESLLKNSTDKTLISLMYVNNEIGTILDVEKVGDLSREYNALFHCDMVQAIGHYEVNLSKLNVDFTAASAHKFHGPKGVGFSYVRKNSGLKPLIFGGSQERGIRGGTECVHNIVGMDEALRITNEKLAEEKAYVLELKQHFIDTLKNNIEGIKFNAKCDDPSHSTYNLLNVNIPISEDKREILLFHLDINGVACSKGSACQSGSSKGSHVLVEVLDEADLCNPSVRFSFSIFNTKEEIEYVVSVLQKIISGA